MNMLTVGQSREKYWGGRDLPFPVALDGGEVQNPRNYGGKLVQRFRINRVILSGDIQREEE